MKLSTPCKPLLDALETASLAISSRVKMPVLSCAHVSCSKDGRIGVVCDSLDARMLVTYDGAQVDECFSFVASPRLLKAALRGDEATITFKDGILSIESGGKSKLTTIPAEEFPKAWAEVNTKPVDAVRLINAIKVSLSCANPDVNSGDNCVFFDAESGHMFGTNRRSLGVHPVQLPVSESFILPAIQAKIITSCFEADDLSLGKSEGTIALAQGNRSLWLKLQEGKILPHKALLLEGKPVAYVGREAFQRALSALSAFVDEEWQRVSITPKEGQWLATSQVMGNESSLNIEGVEMLEDMEPFIFSHSGISNILQHWTAELVSVRRGPNSIMLMPEDESGCIGVVALIRAS